MLNYLNKHYERNFVTRDVLPQGVESIHRKYDDGTTLFFITNLSKQDINTVAEFNGKRAEMLDPWTGKSQIIGRKTAKKIEVPLELIDGESIIISIYANNDSVQEGINNTEEDSDVQIIEYESIVPEGQNVWPLEFCDLEIDGDIYENISTIDACACVYKRRGFAGDPWDNKVQFKNRYYERNRFYKANGGFKVTYHFDIEDNYDPDKLVLSIEYGERYSIYVNGILVKSEINEGFIDNLIHSYEISGLVHYGENTIDVAAKEFDVELEVEAVTLRGDFGVYDQGSYWGMGKPRDIQLGSWVPQGYPFYYGAMLYNAKVDGNSKEKFEILIPDNNATSTSVSINGHKAGNVNLNGVKWKNISEFMCEGVNDIQIRISGSMKNYFGPHFDSSKPRNVAWPDMWKKRHKQGIAKVEEYDLINYGLSEPFKIRKRS
jgi:hypothetical protein